MEFRIGFGFGFGCGRGFGFGLGDPTSCPSSSKNQRIPITPPEFSDSTRASPHYLFISLFPQHLPFRAPFPPAPRSRPATSTLRERRPLQPTSLLARHAVLAARPYPRRGHALHGPLGLYMRIHSVLTACRAPVIPSGANGRSVTPATRISWTPDLTYPKREGHAMCRELRGQESGKPCSV